MVTLGLRLRKSIGEMINDRLNSFRCRVRDSPNEPLTVRSFATVQGLTFNNFGAAGEVADGLYPS
jgi:hypothetical protein